MQQQSVNIKKALFYTQNNFFSQGANSSSFEGLKNSSEKVNTQQSRVQTPKSLVVSNISSLENLQTIKDQINNLQYSLQHSHHLKPNEKSFYDQIRDQLKQVNQLQNTSLETANDLQQNQFMSKIQKKTAQTNKVESKSLHSLGNDKNATMLKSLLNIKGKNINFVDNRMKNIKQIKIQEKQIFNKQLEEINDQSKKLLMKLKRKYKEDKEMIIETNKKQFDQAKDHFDLRVRQRIDEMFKQKIYEKQNNKKFNFFKKHPKIDSSTSSNDTRQIGTPSNKIWKPLQKIVEQEMQRNQRSTLVSSLKKEGSNNSFSKKKKQKVRFKNDDQKEENYKNSKFKTDYEEESDSYDIDDIQISNYD